MHAASLVDKLVGLLLGANEENESEKVLIGGNPLLFLEDKHKVVPKARLHHDPIHGTGQRYVGRQKDDILT